MSKSRCLLVGRDNLVLERLRRLIKTEFDCLLVSSDPDAMKSAVVAFVPEVGIIQLNQETGGISCGDLLRQMCPAVRVLYLTDGRWPGRVLPTISPLDSATEIWTTVRGARRPPSTISPLSPHTRNWPSLLSAGARLSDHARETVRLLARGMSMKEIASWLQFPVRTVAFDIYCVMEAYGLRDNDDLLRFAAEQELLDENHETISC